MNDRELIAYLREFLDGELMSESGSENLADEAQALLAGLERRVVPEECCGETR